MARRNNRTYRTAAAAAAHSKVVAARQAMLAEEEPMHRYPHPIPRSVSPAAPSPAAPAKLSTPAMTQVLEQLSCQSQLLVDLLGAVNSLTASVLCQKGKT